MKRLTLLVLMSAAVLLSTTAVAAPSCTSWTRQADGTFWRKCVTDSGREYCQVARDGHISNVKCP